MPLDPEEFFPDPFAADPNDSKDTFKNLVRRHQPQPKPTNKGVMTGAQGEHSQQKPPIPKEKQQPQKEQQQSQTTEPQHQAQLEKQKSQRQKQKQKEQLQQQQQQQQQPKPREKTQEELEQEARQRAKDIQTYKSEIYYSSYYYDDIYAYRHVKLPKSISRWLPHYGLLKQKEWEYLGVEQEAQWEHYMVHAPEPHILLFRREFKGVEEQLKNEERQERFRRRKRETGVKEDKNRVAIADNATRAAKRQKP